MSNLARAAVGSPLLRRLVDLGRWAAPGRALDDKGELARHEVGAALAELGVLAPARLGWLYACALELGLVRADGNALVPGPRQAGAEEALRHVGSADNDSADNGALRLWEDAFGVVVDGLPDLVEPWARPWRPRAVRMVHEHVDGPVPLSELIPGLVREFRAELPPGDEYGPAKAGITVRRMLADLAELGAVTMTGVDLPVGETDRRTAERAGVPAWVLFPSFAQHTELTPLGRHAAEHCLRDG